ncbi:MAG TPA: FecR domain-containing protein [Nevskia sp.]|nr:FecR domain-containing protein [Nevskia sp.]
MMLKRWKSSFLASLLLAAGLAGNAWADPQPAGVFKRVEGSVTVQHEGNRVPAVVGMPVYASDHVITGADGSAGLTFEDASLLSVGPSSDLAVDRFTFDTTTYDGAFELSLAQGRLAVVSGKIAKHQQDAMKVRTPGSILGVRGTEFVVEVGGKS